MRRAVHPRAWQVYLTGCGSLLALSLVLPEDPRNGILAAVSLASFVTVVVGTWLNRPLPISAWWLLAAALAITVVAAAASGVQEAVLSHPPAYPSWPDVIYYLEYPLMAGALVLVARQASAFDWDGLFDVVILTCGVAAVGWVFVVDPLLDGGTLGPLALTVVLGYPVLDLVLFGMAVRLYVGPGAIPPMTLLLGAVTSILVGDALTALIRGEVIPATPLDDVLILCAGVFAASAVLHPAGAMMRPTEHEQPTGSTSLPRILFFGAIGLLGPALLMFTVLNPDAHPRGEMWQSLFLAGVTGVISILLIIRLSRVGMLAHERAERLLRLQEQLAHRAGHDALTGLPNRTLLSERLDAALAGVGPGVRAALLLLDLDGFKDVNDTHGHPVGDQLLIAIADRMRLTVPAGQTLARLGGDEFAVVLTGGPADRAPEIAADLLDALREPAEISGHVLHLSASIGLLVVAVEGRTAADAVRDADLALYAAKDAGKNQLVAFEAGLRTERMNRTRLTSELREALDRSGLTVHYQPVVDLRTGRVRAAEALVRWITPLGQIVRPDDFIPLAEESGLIIPLGDWVLARACADARSWYETYGIGVTVNVSGKQLAAPDFAVKILAALDGSGLPGSALVVEITETVLVATTRAEAEQVLARLDRLRDHGVRIAIDDFGTGYSSLAYLRDLPVDVLKIDRAFVPDGTGDPRSDRQRAFTEAILQLSDSLGLDTIAEGVETAEQATLLRTMRCPYAQGYHFARPMPATALTDLLTECGGAALPGAVA